MSAILELPEVRERVQHTSVKLYHQLTELGALPKQTELIRGVIVRKMSKSPLHGSISKRLYDSFLPILPPGLTIRRDDPLTLADSEPEPDIAVVPGTDRDFTDRHPTTAQLVIEVAVSSVALDREMAALYAEAGVPEYWIVLAQQQQIEVYRQPAAGVYREQRTFAVGETLTCASVPAIAVSLRELFGVSAD